MDSVQRYTKTFALTRYRSNMPEISWKRATAVSKNWRGSILEALATKKGASAAEASALRAALRKRSCNDGAWISEGASAEDCLSDDGGWATD